MKKSFNYSSKRPSTKVSSVAIVCKWFIYYYYVSSSAHSLSVIILNTPLCRMKSMICKWKGVFDTGFVDPNWVNERMLEMFPKDTEDNLLLFLQKLEYRKKILFPYNFMECYRLVHIHFCLLDVKCKWWLTDVYKPAWRVHWILLNIEPDFGRVEIMDSLKKTVINTKAWLICSRGNFNCYRNISVFFVQFLRYQVTNNSFIHFLPGWV
jgi:hypothetical protein